MVKFFASFLVALSVASCDPEGIIKDRIENSIPPLKPTIVLCHGLNDNLTSLKDITVALQCLKGHIITPYEEKTANTAIQDQGNGLVNTLKKQGLEKTKPIILVGNSQGGLRAYWAALQLKEEYNVVGVVTIGTPWEGVPVLKQEKLCTLDTLLNLSSDASELLQGLIPFLQSVKEQAYRGYEGKISSNNLHGSSITNTRQSLFGVYDMVPGSKFLEEIKKKLHNNNIPILAIGGDASILSTTINVELQKSLRQLSLDTILGGTPHDLLIPLSSQLATNLCIGEKKHFQRSTIAGVVHFTAAAGAATRSSKVIKEAITFINEQLAIFHAGGDIK